MKHYGDITKIDGHDIPIVDVITGGSPCQDLSVAGLRKGLAGERSGLFLHQIRIIKEMRDNDRRNGRTGKFIRPNWGIWENVPGALSSAPKGQPKGADFQAVLHEFCKIVCEEAPPVPIPPKGWPNAGCISGMGDGGVPFSISWRMVDAQFWGKAQYLDGRMLFRGTPQRRKRLALVADFGGIGSPEILFERASLFGDPAESGETWERTPEGSARGIGATSYTLKIRGGREIDSLGKRAGKGPLVQEEKSGTLGVSQDQTLITVTQPTVFDARVMAVENHPNDSRLTLSEDGVFQTLSGRMGTGGGNTPMVLETGAFCIGNGQVDQAGLNPLVGALNCMHDQQAVITYGIDRAAFNQGENAKYDFSIEEELIGAQTARGPGAVYNSVVRRLTPLECERLQGFPDGWTDIGEWIDSKGKKHKDADSPRYKALGNSIALPFWQYLARRICAQYERPVTMGSLFDGIGGFPLVFERCGAKAVWASEIEEFPIAVTKKHFQEDEE